MIMNVSHSQSARSGLALAGFAVLALLVCASFAPPLAAQETPEKKDDAQAAATPAAATEGFRFGMYEGHSDIEVGYRWVSDTAGSRDMYRSMINLGEGPKLLRSNLSLRSKYGTGGLFDRLDLSMDSWGGDPYNTMRLNMSRSGVYEFRADYRNLSYFNSIPGYANPLLAQGNLSDQHALDVRYRSTDLELKLYPDNKIRPFFGYTRTSGFGPGLTTYGLTGNEFVLNTHWQYASDEYRGGLEISIPTLVLRLEQGYRFLRDDTSANDTTQNPGNGNNATFLGRQVNLASLDRGNHDRTAMPVTKLMAKWSPLSYLKFTGRYVYSIADVDTAQGEVRNGSLVSLEDRLFYRSALDGANGSAKMPNHNGAFGVEFSPFSRLTLIDQFETRRNHITGAAVLSSAYIGASSLSGGSRVFDTTVQHLLGASLAYNQTRNQAEADIDLGSGFVLRGGYRYTTIDASLSDTADGETDSSDAGITQHTGIFGVAYRPSRRMHFGLNWEVNNTSGRLVRTDMLDYSQVKFDWRVDPVKTLSLSGSVSVLTNRGLYDKINLDAHNRNYTVALTYEPCQRFSLNLDYQRSSILSALDIILPQRLDVARSFFDERGSSVGAGMGVDFYHGLRTDLGYRVILNAGSYPLNYYQPYASLTIPLQNHFAIKSQWQYYGYNEKGTNLQDYRTHLVTIGLAFSR